MSRRGSAVPRRGVRAPLVQWPARVATTRPGRLDSRKRTGPDSSRGAANVSTSRDGESSHCTSSTAIKSGCRAATARKTFRAASAIARDSGGRPLGSARRRATSSARRCGAGSSRSSSASIWSNRSMSAANASRAGALLALVESTTKPRRARRSDAGLPERGLADARPTDQHQRLGAVPAFEELVQQGKLRLSPDRLRADASDGCQRWALLGGLIAHRRSGDKRVEQDVERGAG